MLTSAYDIDCTCAYEGYGKKSLTTAYSIEYPGSTSSAISYYDKAAFSKNSTLTVTYDGYLSTSTSKYNKECNFLNGWYHSDWDCYDHSESKPKSTRDKIQEIIQSRHSPIIIVQSRTSVKSTTDLKEICARQTIKRILGEKEYREYVKDGFISVKARSGLVYQIYPGSGITRVYKDGVLIERLCVVLKGNFPPTDSLIMRFLLILNDENDFRRQSIKHGIALSSKKIIVQDNRSLVEIAKSLKKTA